MESLLKAMMRMQSIKLWSIHDRSRRFLFFSSGLVPASGSRVKPSIYARVRAAMAKAMTQAGLVSNPGMN
ncbi:MAG: hypothetical protein FD137_1284 [Spirochaetes bacterium]|nr:MAG: hypothetical protein FD137_1284 [Spirochaetota bacterium]